MTKYTAADFANAQFAKDSEGNLAARIGRADYPWIANDSGWEDGIQRYTDLGLEHEGDWVPVPTKPTITYTHYRELIDSYKAHRENTLVGINRFELARQLGIEIIPDPEPTNTERLEQLIRESDFKVSGYFGYYSIGAFAKYLNDHGVTAPDEDGK